MTMRKFTLDEVQDSLVGPVGTPERDAFELEVRMELIGAAIRRTRKKRHLTQEELGRRIGVQKSQISRLENNPGNVSLETIVRVFSALDAPVTFHVSLATTDVQAM